jgi:hypothetical protein
MLTLLDQALRSDWKGSPLAHSLPQVLRTIGWYIDQRQGRLHKIAHSGGSLSIFSTQDSRNRETCNTDPAADIRHVGPFI